MLSDETFVHWDGDEWSPVEPPVPDGEPQRLRGIWGLRDAGEAWAFTRRSILHYEGGQWHHEKTVSRNLGEFHSTGTIDGSGPDDVWIGDEEGGLWHWDGSSWSRTNPSATSSDSKIFAVGSAASDDVWAVARHPTDSSDAIFLRYDGSSWSEYTYQSPTTGVDEIWAPASDNVWACTGDGLMHYDGEGWRETDGPACRDMFGLQAGQAWIRTENGFYRRTNSGWEKLSTPYDKGEFWAWSEDNKWILGAKTHHFTGGDWQRVTETPVIEELELVWGAQPDDIWAFGRNTVLHYDGTEWSEHTEAPDIANPVDAWGSGPDDIWLINDRLIALDSAPGPLFHWDGSNWSEADLPTEPDGHLQAIWGSGPDDVWIGGADRLSSDYHETTMYRFDGSSWSVYEYFDAPDGFEQITSMWGSTSDDIWAVSDDEAAIRYDGKGWKGIEDGSLGELVTGISADNVWGFGAGSSANVYRWDGSSVSATNWEMPPPRAVWGAADDDIWAVGVGNDDTLPAQMSWYNGAEWVTFRTPRNIELLDVHGFGRDDIWAVGKSGTIVRHQ